MQAYGYSGRINTVKSWDSLFMPLNIEVMALYLKMTHLILKTPKMNHKHAASSSTSFGVKNKALSWVLSQLGLIEIRHLGVIFSEKVPAPRGK